MYFVISAINETFRPYITQKVFPTISYAKDITAFGKCVGYGIDYRDMHNALHGVLVYSDRREAEEYYDDLKRAEQAEDEHEYNDIVDTAFSCAVEDIDDINYRDYVETGSDKIYPIYDDEFIILVNRVAVDLYV